MSVHPTPRCAKHVKPVVGQLQRRVRNSHQWQRVRNLYRQENPLCCDPLKLHSGPEPVQSVHHVNPVLTHPNLAFAWTNLRSLCDACHSEIERLERSGQPTQHLFHVEL